MRQNREKLSDNGLQELMFLQCNIK